MFILESFFHNLDLIDDDHGIKKIKNRQYYHDNLEKSIANSLIIEKGKKIFKFHTFCLLIC